MVINFLDPQIWVAISFIVFFLIFGKIIWTKLSSFLENKINLINDEIKEAQDLHAEAVSLLTEEKKKAQDLENQIKKIMENGKMQASELVEENKIKINSEIANLERSCNDKIKLMEQEILNELKSKVIDKALNKSVISLQNNLSRNNHKDIMKDSLKLISKQVQNQK